MIKLPTKGEVTRIMNLGR
ncbi:hypothetical protein LINGRAHAP2_LOCUS28890 [Linum grandiflorum]